MKKMILTVLCMVALPAAASGTVAEQMLDSYREQGASDASASRGKAMWNEKHIQKKSGKEVSCATCHTTDLTKTGAHARTGKLIEPMAPSVNAERLTDPAKIRKWFRRNCKWTIGRECTPQEKADFLSFIQSN
jgi:cytochrome c peroxidase